MTKAWTLLAVVPFAFGCAATSGAQIPAPSRSTSSAPCEIRATPIPGGVRLDALVRGAPGAAGSYRFTLEKNGADGSSKVGQGGAFVIPASGENAVARTELGLGRTDTYRADMMVNGTIKCAKSEAPNSRAATTVQ